MFNVETQTQKFRRRLEKTQSFMKQQLGTDDPKALGKALEVLDIVDSTSRWLPLPSSPGGTGSTDEDSKRNAGGIRR